MTFYFPLPEKIAKSKKIIYDCDKCGIYSKNVYNNLPKMKPVIGKHYNGLVIVASKPSIDDDKKGMPLINEKAKIIRSSFLKNRINLQTSAAITYAACCQSKTVTDVQFKCCRETFLADRLKELKPKVIVTLGEMAFKSVMGIKNKIGSTKIRNRIVPNFEFNCVVFPIFDPNALFMYHYKQAIGWDIERICRLWHKNYRKRNYINKLLESRKILEDITIHEVKPHEVESVLNEIHTFKEVALDYETTNVNPFDKFFEITHVSFSLKQTAWVFHESLWENNLEVFDLITSHMQQILSSPKILKIIQNAKFEDLCSRYVFNIKSIRNSFCTMLATHTVDERRGCTSLDFQNLVRFGIPPYSETVKSFLIPKTKDHKVNTIREAPHDDMILYAGLDVITTFNNYLVLTEEIMPNAYDKAFENYQLLHKGHWVFANMTQRGIPIGENEFSEIDSRLDLEINKVIKNISNIPEFIEYNEYLSNKDISTKTGDKKVQELIESTKRKEIVYNDNNGIHIRNEKNDGKSNRKISFT